MQQTDHTPCVQKHTSSQQQVHARALSQGGSYDRVLNPGSGAVDEPHRKLSSILDYLDSVSHQVLRIPESGHSGVLPIFFTWLQLDTVAHACICIGG